MRIKDYIRRKLHYYRLYYNIRHEKGKRTTTTVSDIIMCNIDGNKWIRMDIVVRYLAIECYYGFNDYGWELYNKMQDRRVRKGYSVESLENFKALIDSIEKNGYDMNSYITVDREYNLLDGSHRLALSLYFDIFEIPILIIDSKEVSDYSIGWFEENGFTENEIKLICNKRDEMANKYDLINV